MGRPPGGDSVRETHTEIGSPLSGERKPVLLVLGPGGILEFDLPWTEPAIVGRTPTAQIHIDDPSVSRVHARLESGPQGLVLSDQGSRNGTFVNEIRIDGTGTPLKVGDQLRFGNVTAYLHMVKAKRHDARILLPDEFDGLVADEAERCVRFDRTIGLLALETSVRAGAALELARTALVRQLRALDMVTVRGPGRVDVLLTDCRREEALTVARRIVEALGEAAVPARVGVAVFPGSAPSAESLVMAAEVAMRSVDRGIGEAGAAIRRIQVGARDVVVADPAMVRLWSLIDRVAIAPVPVLIQGETGSGKEIVAEAIHAFGPRAHRRLVKINCAALPENLLESELFGYERGAFSGAMGPKPGLIEEADGGTLFLDEIGDMPLSLQAKLLRVIEDRRVRRLGSLREKDVDLRIVAATHRNMRSAVADGSFRQDLYYRLNGINLFVPPLRDRRREIPLLAERFAAEATSATGRPLLRLSSGALAALEAYDWPGNVRELKNAISAAVVLCEGDELEVRHLPPEIAGAAPSAAPASHVASPSSPGASAELVPGSVRRRGSGHVTAEIRPPLEEELRSVERRRILEALEQTGGNQTRAAELLKMPRRTLVAKLAALGIPGPRRRRTGPGPNH